MVGPTIINSFMATCASAGTLHVLAKSFMLRVYSDVLISAIGVATITSLSFLPVLLSIFGPAARCRCFRKANAQNAPKPS